MSHPFLRRQARRHLATSISERPFRDAPSSMRDDIEQSVAAFEPFACLVWTFDHHARIGMANASSGHDAAVNRDDRPSGIYERRVNGAVHPKRMDIATGNQNGACIFAIKPLQSTKPLRNTRKYPYAPAGTLATRCLRSSRKRIGWFRNRLLLLRNTPFRTRAPRPVPFLVHTTTPFL